MGGCDGTRVCVCVGVCLCQGDERFEFLLFQYSGGLVVGLKGVLFLSVLGDKDVL